MKNHGVVVRCVDAVDGRVGTCFSAADFIAEERVERPLDVARSQGLPIVEADSMMQMKNIGLRIRYFPTISQPRLQVEVIVPADQRIEEQFVDSLRLRIHPDPGVKIRGAALNDHHQRVVVGLARTTGEEQNHGGTETQKHSRLEARTLCNDTTANHRLRLRRSGNYHHGPRFGNPEQYTVGFQSPAEDEPIHQCNKHAPARQSPADHSIRPVGSWTALRTLRKSSSVCLGMPGSKQRRQRASYMSAAPTTIRSSAPRKRCVCLPGLPQRTQMASVLVMDSASASRSGMGTKGRPR